MIDKSLPDFDRCFVRFDFLPARRVMRMVEIAHDPPIFMKPDGRHDANLGPPVSGEETLRVNAEHGEASG
jgi:hypothetical protein